jgi:hypothetical protein
MNAVAPLHRAVRTRAAAVRIALTAGRRAAKERTRLDPVALATCNTGRRQQARPRQAQQAEIVRLLERHGATG